jgi:hypothetical protein
VARDRHLASEFLRIPRRPLSQARALDGFVAQSRSALERGEKADRTIQ